MTPQPVETSDAPKHDIDDHRSTHTEETCDRNRSLYNMRHVAAATSHLRRSAGGPKATAGPASFALPPKRRRVRDLTSPPLQTRAEALARNVHHRRSDSTEKTEVLPATNEHRSAH
jgi:hypothetical protein